MRRVAAILALLLLLGAVLAGCSGGSDVIDSEDIADGAVTRPKISGGAVGVDELGQDVKDALSEAGANLAAAPIGTNRLKDGAVTTPKIAPRAVTTDTIADLAVGRGRIANNAVNGAKVEDGSLTGADIDGSTVENVDAAQLRGQSDYLRNVSTVSNSSPSNATAYKGPVTANCPSGKKLVGGGAVVVMPNGSRLRIALVSSGPGATAGRQRRSRSSRPRSSGASSRTRSAPPSRARDDLAARFDPAPAPSGTTEETAVPLGHPLGLRP
jgi:hypothetical protein